MNNEFGVWFDGWMCTGNVPRALIHISTGVVYASPGVVKIPPCVLRTARRRARKRRGGAGQSSQQNGTKKQNHTPRRSQIAKSPKPRNQNLEITRTKHETETKINRKTRRTHWNSGNSESKSTTSTPRRSSCSSTIAARNWSVASSRPRKCAVGERDGIFAALFRIALGRSEVSRQASKRQEPSERVSASASVTRHR